MEFTRDPLNAELFEHEQARTQEQPEEELRDQVDNIARRSRDIRVLSFVDEGVERCPWERFQYDWGDTRGTHTPDEECPSEKGIVTMQRSHPVNVSTRGYGFAKGSAQYAIAW